MYEALLDPIFHRLQTNEDAAITEVAEAAIAEEVREEQMHSDEGLLASASLHLGKLMFRARELQANRGIVTKFLSRNDPKVTLGREIKGSLGATDQVARFDTISTPLLSAEAVVSGALTFDVGWRVGIKKLVRVGSSSIPHLNYFRYPMSISRVAVECNSSVSNSQLWYEVNMTSGRVRSYIDGAPNDEILTAYGDAHHHAAWIIRQATDLLE